MLTSVTVGGARRRHALACSEFPPPRSRPRHVRLQAYFRRWPGLIAAGLAASALARLFLAVELPNPLVSAVMLVWAGAIGLDPNRSRPRVPVDVLAALLPHVAAAQRAALQRRNPDFHLDL